MTLGFLQLRYLGILFQIRPISIIYRQMTTSWKIEVLEIDVYRLLSTFRVVFLCFGVPYGFLGSFQEIGVAGAPGRVAGAIIVLSKLVPDSQSI